MRYDPALGQYKGFFNSIGDTINNLTINTHNAGAAKGNGILVTVGPFLHLKSCLFQSSFEQIYISAWRVRTLFRSAGYR